jgi:hypothetical protein
MEHLRMLTTRGFLALSTTLGRMNELKLIFDLEGQQAWSNEVGTV